MRRRKSCPVCGTRRPGTGQIHGIDAKCPECGRGGPSTSRQTSVRAIPCGLPGHGKRR